MCEDLEEFLENLEYYLDNIADADENGTLPNEEMRLLISLREAMPLFKAAPELLKALKWAEAAISPFSKEPQEKSGINLMRIAIAKAEGRFREAQALAEKQEGQS